MEKKFRVQITEELNLPGAQIQTAPSGDRCIKVGDEYLYPILSWVRFEEVSKVDGLEMTTWSEPLEDHEIADATLSLDVKISEVSDEVSSD